MPFSRIPINDSSSTRTTRSFKLNAQVPHPLQIAHKSNTFLIEYSSSKQLFFANMRVFIALLTMLAGLGIVSPPKDGRLEKRCGNEGGLYGPRWGSCWDGFQCSVSSCPMTVRASSYWQHANVAAKSMDFKASILVDHVLQLHRKEGRAGLCGDWRWIPCNLRNRAGGFTVALVVAWSSPLGLKFGRPEAGFLSLRFLSINRGLKSSEQSLARNNDGDRYLIL